MLQALVFLVPAFGEDKQDALQVEQTALRILQANCLVCHNAEGADGGYSLSDSRGAFRPGDSGNTPIVDSAPEESELWKRLISEDESIRMPLDAEPLSESELQAIRSWIESKPSWRNDPESTLLERVRSGTTHPLEGHTPLLEKYGDRYPSPAFAYADARKKLYVGGWGEVLVWNTESSPHKDPDKEPSRLLHRWGGFGKRILALALSSDARWLAVSSGSPGLSGSVHAIDLENPTVGMEIYSEPDIPSAIAFAPHENLLAIGTMSGKVALVRPESGERILEVAAHADQVLSLAWREDGKMWISGSRDRTARVSDYPSGELRVAYAGHDRTVCWVGFGKFGPMTRDETGSLRMWDLDSGNRVHTRRADLPQHLEPVWVFGDTVYWQDGQKLASAKMERRSEETGEKDGAGKPKTRLVYGFKRGENLAPHEDILRLVPVTGDAAIGWFLKDRSFGFSPLGKEDKIPWSSSRLEVYP